MNYANLKLEFNKTSNERILNDINKKLHNCFSNSYHTCKKFDLKKRCCFKSIVKLGPKFYHSKTINNREKNKFWCVMIPLLRLIHYLKFFSRIDKGHADAIFYKNKINKNKVFEILDSVLIHHQKYISGLLQKANILEKNVDISYNVYKNSKVLNNIK